jgi:hypothetical protein
MSKSAAHPRVAATQRLIGVEHAENGKSVTIAMIETDGHGRIRRFQSSVTPLRAIDRSANVARVIELVTAYLGDLALQPFAIDRVGVRGPAAAQIADALSLHLDLACVVVTGEQTKMGNGRLTSSEHVALAALLTVSAD